MNQRFEEHRLDPGGGGTGECESENPCPLPYLLRVPPLLQISGVTKRYRQARGRYVEALRGIDLEVPAGEFLAIMGPSGSGKSTLFNLIGALDKPTTGEVTLGGLSLPRLRPKQLAFVRCRHIGYVFQAYNLVASLSARKNVALPAVFGGAGVAEADALAEAQLEAVGLGHRLDHRPDQLLRRPAAAGRHRPGAGQPPRPAARRRAHRQPRPPDRLGGDRPLPRARRSRGMTVVTTTHDHQMLQRSDRVVWIRDGQKVREASSAELEIQTGGVG